MYKTFLTTLCAAALATTASAASFIADSDKSISGSFDDVQFTTDGVTITLNSGTNITSDDAVTVAEGVNATLKFNGAAQAAFAMGTASADGTATISGAGVDKSSLSFSGYIIGSTWNERATKNVAIKNITFNMINDGTTYSTVNLIRGAGVSFESAKLHILDGGAGKASRLEAYGNTGFSFKNSSLIVDKNAALDLNFASGISNSNTKLTLASSSLDINGTMTLNSTGFIYTDAKSTINVASGATLTCTYVELVGKMVVSGNASIGSKIRMFGGSTLVLNSSNIDGVNGYKANMGSGITKNQINVYGSATVEVNAANSLCFAVTKADQAKTITVILGDLGENDYLLNLVSLVSNPYTDPASPATAYYDHNDILSGGGVFYDFINLQDGSVVISKANVTEEVLSASLSHLLSNGVASKIGYESKTIDGVEYWALTNVPEPSTYAMVLGGLAIAFAFMRRRR